MYVPLLNIIRIMINRPCVLSFIIFLVKAIPDVERRFHSSFLESLPRPSSISAIGSNAVARELNTVSDVRTQQEFSSALASGATIEVKANIQVFGAFSLAGINGVVINGNGFTLDCQLKSGMGCFAIEGSTTSVTINDLVLTRGYSVFGGAVAIQTGATVTMNRVKITNSISLQGGGGLYISGGTLVMSFCNVSDNLGAFAGGGIAILSSASTVTLRSCLITRNTVSQFLGAGLIVFGGSNVAIYDCTFSHNGFKLTMSPSTTEPPVGAAMYLDTSNVHIERVTIANHSSLPYGWGPLHLFKARVTVIDSEISLNQALFGAGVVGTGAIATFTGTVFKGNHAVYEGVVNGADRQGGAGGGMFFQSGSYNFTNCTIEGNVADIGGGGVYVGNAVTTQTNLNFQNCKLIGNIAVGPYGGGTPALYPNKISYSSA